MLKDANSNCSFKVQAVGQNLTAESLREVLKEFILSDVSQPRHANSRVSGVGVQSCVT